MTRTYLWIQATFIILVHAVTATDYTYHGTFGRDICLNRTLELLANGTLSRNDSVFFKDAAGQPMSYLENMTFTLPGCRQLCGAKQAWYTDIGPRLSVWLIPVLLLLSNVELSPLDKRRFLAILHLLGDPIDSIWSLVHKLDCWDRCYSVASEFDDACENCQQIIAAVFAGFEEVYGPEISTREGLLTLAEDYKVKIHFDQWRKTAVELVDGRTDEFVRTCFAILLYVFQLVSNFVTQIGGGNSSPPGGRIATGVFLSWLIPTVLLSNAIGNFTSRRTCYSIMSRFARKIDKPLSTPPFESTLLRDFPQLSRKCTTSYFDSLGWRGAIHTYRPWKLERTPLYQRSWRAKFAFFIALSPVCMSMLGGFVILWYSVPLGFNCRHVWLIGIFIVWLISASLTWLTYSVKIATGKYHWRFVLVKDALFAVPSMTIIVLSACGLFNSCYCWSGTLYYGARARFPLHADAVFESFDRTIYPTVVGIFTVLQVVVFFVIMYAWRRGLRVLRWSDRAREIEWTRRENYEVCDCGGPAIRQSRCAEDEVLSDGNDLKQSTCQIEELTVPT